MELFELNVTEEQGVIEVTGQHPALRGTILENRPVVFKVLPVTRTKLAKIRKSAVIKVRGEIDLDIDKFHVGVLLETLVGWNLSEGGKEIPCDNKMKLAFCEKYPSLASPLATVGLNGKSASLEEDDEEEDSTKETELGN